MTPFEEFLNAAEEEAGRIGRFMDEMFPPFIGPTSPQDEIIYLRGLYLRLGATELPGSKRC